jgi:hypothetical protein
MREVLECTNCDVLAASVRRLFEFASPELRDRKVLESVADFQKGLSDICRIRECKRTVLPPFNSKPTD